MTIAHDIKNLHCEIYGQGDVIIFLNGFASGISTWYPVIKDLRKTFKCVLYDYVGTGESNSPEDYVFSLESYCLDLDALIASLEVERVHLVGYSMGGWIAQHFAARRPSAVSSLTLINSSSKIFPHQNWAISHFINVLRDSHIDEFSKLLFISYYSPEYFEKNVENLDRIKNLAVLTLVKQVKENWEKILASCLPFDAESFLAECKIPMLAISGEHDFLCPKMTAKRLVSLVPDLKSVEFDSVGHAIPMERYQDLRKVIKDFLPAPSAA